MLLLIFNWKINLNFIEVYEGLRSWRAKELAPTRWDRSDWWFPNIWLWANLLSGTPHFLSSLFQSMHNFIYVVLPNCPSVRTQKNDSQIRAIMNVMFGYYRMLLSGASYWGSSTWARTKGVKVVWWSTPPRLRAWVHFQVHLFMLPRSIQSSALLALSE